VQQGTHQQLRLRLMQAHPSLQQYRVLQGLPWETTTWGQACSRHSSTEDAEGATVSICHLPSRWRNCTQGIYLDVVSFVQSGQPREKDRLYLHTPVAPLHAVPCD
jgi:hypothetical protein